LRHKNCIAIVKDVIPDIIDNAYFLVRFLQQSGGTDSVDELYRKAVVMTRLIVALKPNYSDEVIEDALASIARQNFKDKTVDKILKGSLPEDLLRVTSSIPAIELTCRFSSLYNELYGSTDNMIHSYLSALYYENAEK